MRKAEDMISFYIWILLSTQGLLKEKKYIIKMKDFGRLFDVTY